MTYRPTQQQSQQSTSQQESSMNRSSIAAAHDITIGQLLCIEQLVPLPTTEAGHLLAQRWPTAAVSAWSATVPAEYLERRPTLVELAGECAAFASDPFEMAEAIIDTRYAAPLPYERALARRVARVA